MTGDPRRRSTRARRAGGRGCHSSRRAVLPCGTCSTESRAARADMRALHHGAGTMAPNRGIGRRVPLAHGTYVEGARAPAWENGASPSTSETYLEETEPPPVSSPAALPSAPEPGRTDPAVLRNFCIIAHIDHGKSTLADRMLQLTGVVDARTMRAQYLDRMDIERERGITIKSQAVRMPWTVRTGNDTGRTFVLNMIDTPGHVDFTYEVSRSLEACEAAVLLVDAAQGIEAQTLANLYLALGADLHVIPVLNKIDLPGAEPEKYAAELAGIIGCDPTDVLRVSAKTGEGVADLLDEIVRQTPPPVGVADASPRALIFDSVYDTYRGVVTYVRVVDGKLTHRDRIKMMSTGAVHEMLEVGVISPEPIKAGEIGVGEVGYLITGVKEVRQSRVGDTVTSATVPATEPLSGYQHPNPMVFAGLYPLDGDDYPT